MSRPSRDKGLRAEREVVAAHVELGIAGERVPLSGAARYRGNGADVDADLRLYRQPVEIQAVGRPRTDFRACGRG